MYIINYINCCALKLYAEAVPDNVNTTLLGLWGYLLLGAGVHMVNIADLTYFVWLLVSPYLPPVPPFCRKMVVLQCLVSVTVTRQWPVAGLPSLSRAWVSSMPLSGT